MTLVRSSLERSVTRPQTMPCHWKVSDFSVKLCKWLSLSTKLESLISQLLITCLQSGLLLACTECSLRGNYQFCTRPESGDGDGDRWHQTPNKRENSSDPKTPHCFPPGLTEHCSFLHRSSWISFSDSSETGVCLVRCDDGGGPVVRDIPSLGVTLVRVMRSSL